MMKRRIFALALISLASPALAQDADPYAGAERSQIRLEYKAQNNAYLRKVQNLYIAWKCKVLHTEGEANAVAIALYEQLRAEWLTDLARTGNADLIVKTATQADAARREGVAIAAKPGACDWYREHPESAAEIRSASRAAIGALSGHPY